MNKNIFSEEVQVFTPEAFEDYRGELWTTWKKDEFPIDLEFNHDKITTTRKNVIRGIHGDNKSWKLVTCLYGELYFVVVDNRKDSFSLKWNDKKIGINWPISNPILSDRDNNSKEL
jgi:dTDP-4-dehydrorhamnose 3,5-epimerase